MQKTCAFMFKFFINSQFKLYFWLYLFFHFIHNKVYGLTVKHQASITFLSHKGLITSGGITATFKNNNNNKNKNIYINI